MRRLATATAIVTLTLAPSASAIRAHHAHRPAVGWVRVVNPLQVAIEKARALWGVEPCGGSYRVQLDAPAIDAGVATFDTPTGAGYYTSPASTWTSCVLHLRASDWTAHEVETNWPQLCSVVLHEYGHLTGHTHSDEADSPAPGATYTPEQAAVMLSGSTGYASDTARCGLRV
jgi:hypothetical protein